MRAASCVVFLAVLTAIHLTGCEKIARWRGEQSLSHAAALEAEGRTAEAMVEYQEAVVRAPDSCEAHNGLGQTLAKSGRVDEAIAHYRMALELKPDYGMAHNNLGKALAGQGRVDEAIAHYTKAVALDPTNAEAVENLKEAKGHRSETK